MEYALSTLLGDGDEAELDRQAAETILSEDTLFRERVTHKTLRISKIFGIEGKKLLTGERI
jgi:hypothetical protein